MLDAIKWRSIGPYRGGRTVAVAGDPLRPLVFYFGSVAGGVFKTTDGGRLWQCVSDGQLGTPSVGAIAVSASDPNVIYVGMGEACIRGNVTHGDGVYRSTDAGRTWHHLGLADTRHIARVRIHPTDPDTAYVAALGHAYGPNDERGIFRTHDGGRSFERVLFRDERTGAADLAIDPDNPRTLYAALWQAGRTPWHLESGGPGSGLFRSDDGGDTWTELSDRPGMPKGVKGRIGVAPSPARPGRLWAFVEAAEGGLLVSDDRGEHWKMLTRDPELAQRAWYYSHVFADPKDENTVWVLNVNCLRSVDGGSTFHPVATPHGDNHDLWIDPHNPLRMIEGNDGGATVTFDGGETWSSLQNQPTAQFYHVAVDTRRPYRVYGAQQDNTTLAVPSRTDTAAITLGDCYPVGGGESGYIQVRPDNPDIVYAGSYSLLTRYDHASRSARNVLPWPENPMGHPAEDLRYRFQWTFPILVSPHDPDTLYCAANVVFRSRDEGRSWDVVSPDLTAADPATLGTSGGPLSQDNTSVEYYATVFALAESPLARGLLWAGSDDGRIHVTSDGGGAWADVTPADLPPNSQVSIIEASPHDADSAYVAICRYRLDDLRPYLLRTADRGRTWTRIDTGLPADETTRVVRADPVRRGLLYAGTEKGVYVSYDDGGSWQPLRGNLPVVPVHDLAVAYGDLVAATHGRSFWILDDLTPVREAGADAPQNPLRLFTPRPTVLPRGGRLGPPVHDDPGLSYRPAGALTVTARVEGGGVPPRLLDAGENPPAGLVVQYWLQEAPADDAELRLEFLDAEGRQIRSYTSRKAPEAKAKDGTEAPPVVSAKAGLNRFVWDCRHPGATGLEGVVLWAGNLLGPVVAPGTYTVRLCLGETSAQASFELVPDPRTADDAPEDLAAQTAFLLEVRDEVSRVHAAVARIRRVRADLGAWRDRIGSQSGEAADGAKAAIASLLEALEPIEEALIQPRIKVHEDPLNYPIRLNNKLASLANAAATAPGRPARQAEAVFGALRDQAEAEIARLDALLHATLSDVNGRLRALDLPFVDDAAARGVPVA